MFFTFGSLAVMNEKKKKLSKLHDMIYTYCRYTSRMLVRYSKHSPKTPSGQNDNDKNNK